MKQLLIIASIALFCTCCTHFNNGEISQKQLWITSSVGAFNGEKTGDILPENAYVIISPVSAGNIALDVVYSWGEYGGISIEVPEIRITGSDNDFTFSQEGVSARCRLSFARKDYQDVIIDLSGHYSKGGEEPFTLILSPKDNTICPWLEIKEVSPTSVELPLGGADVEFPASKLVIDNQLTIPVTIKWAYDNITPISISAKETKSCWCLNYSNESSFPPSTLIADGQEYALDLFAEGKYTKENKKVYHFIDGIPDTHRYIVYTVALTPELYASLTSSR